MTDSSVTGFVAGETYPIMLLNDARRLVEKAFEGNAKRTNELGIPSPEERAAARAAIFTSFNLLEGLLIELTQAKIAAGGTKCSHCDDAILDELKEARANISRTMTEWPIKVLGVCVTGQSEFGRLKEIRTLRNQLIHPKLETQKKDERSQDDLLKECNADRSKEILHEICRMCKVLYTVYGQRVPPEFEDAIKWTNGPTV